MVPVALLHFVTGPRYSGPFPAFVNGYLIDILLPFALYFLLCPQDVRHPFLRPWFVKAAPVFAIGVAVETAQYFGVPIFGRTFDPVDYAMYALGTILAAVIDTLVLPNVFPFWKTWAEPPREGG
jgi:hypothetical protein